MLHLDISGSLGKAITPSKGIPDQEMGSVRTAMRRYVQDWLKERENGEHAWSMNPYDRKLIDEARDMARRIKSEGVQTVVWIGIGGSSLGPQVIKEAFELPTSVEFVIIDTIDPAVLDLMVRLVDWKTAFLVVASKSGNTLETMSAFFLCWELLRAARKDKASERTVAITDPESGPLRGFCLDQDISMLTMPKDVGGRYSIFTSIGLLPLALLGGNINQFIRGAKEMDTVCQRTTLDDNPAALLASTQFLLHTKRGHSLRVIMPYSQRLMSIARWNQQLIAESLGKNEVSNPVPYAAVGTQDQHSLLQQWMAGPRHMWHLFIREDDKPRLLVPEKVEPSFQYIAGKTFGQLLDACYEGTSQALTSVKRPHVTLTLPRLDEYHLGQLFYLLLTEVVFLGKLYRIDPYGQPAVETGKTITKEILARGRG